MSVCELSDVDMVEMRRKVDIVLQNAKNIEVIMGKTKFSNYEKLMISLTLEDHIWNCEGLMTYEEKAIIMSAQNAVRDALECYETKIAIQFSLLNFGEYRGTKPPSASAPAVPAAYRYASASTSELQSKYPTASSKLNMLQASTQVATGMNWYCAGMMANIAEEVALEAKKKKDQKDQKKP